MRPFRFRTLATVCALAALPGLALATDLVNAWRAAERNDREHAVARAAQAAAQPRRDQAAALWRPERDTDEALAETVRWYRREGWL